jgi:hypothetical protein
MTFFLNATMDLRHPEEVCRRMPADRLEGRTDGNAAPTDLADFTET